MGEQRKLKKGDWILISIGVIIGVLLIGIYLNSKPGQLSESGKRIAVITRNGSKMAEVDLNQIKEPQYFKYEDGIGVVILAENGSIRFLEADCPDKICIKTGTLTKPGDQAICMPSKTIVRVLDD